MQIAGAIGAGLLTSPDPADTADRRSPVLAAIVP